MISLDCETTGLDLRHGCRPFLVTMCDEEGMNTYWEFDVDPLTRQVVTKGKSWRSFLSEFRAEVEQADEIVFQNPKFDVAALELMGAWVEPWPWHKTLDTLLAGHLLGSNEPHDLTSMALLTLNMNVKPFEDDVQEATEEARKIAKKDYPDWRIAKKGLPELPSAKEKVWKNDMWLPRAVAKERKYPKDHLWWNVCLDYANSDSAITFKLFQKQKELIEERGLWKIYQERLKILPIVYQMEKTGVTINQERLEELTEQYTGESDRCHRVCVNLSDGHLTKMPKNGVSNQLRTTLFDHFKLVPCKKTKKNAPSMDKEVIEDWLAKLPRNGKEYLFVKNLAAYRKRQTALGYMESYRKFWLPLQKDWVPGKMRESKDWYILHPSLNPTGTDTLRWSSQGPNEQQISKKEGFNLRYCFGPAPGREWWSMDARNIELRIPAYEAGEMEMIRLFERPNDPPYFGSYHLLIFDVLHPKLFAKYGIAVKHRFASTQYSWIKAGNFAVQYGAMLISGTADRAYHVDGAQLKVQNRFRNIAKLNRKMIALAEQQGYVETMPDKMVDPDRGYPLLAGKNQWGRLRPTTPLNYHVQGTAMQVMSCGMVKVQNHLNKLNIKAKSKYHVIAQIHDEIVLDFPYNPNRGNLSEVLKIKTLLDSVGPNLNPSVPIPFGVEYHPDNWSETMEIAS